MDLLTERHSAQLLSNSCLGLRSDENTGIRQRFYSCRAGRG